MVLDVVPGNVLLFLLDIKIENRCVRLAGDDLYGKRLFTWLSLISNVFDGILFCVVLFPTRCLG